MQHICKEKWQSKVVFLLAGAAFALSATAFGALPSGYTQYTYIQGDGSSARIVIDDYTPTPNNDKIEAVLEFPSLDKTMNVWCARGSGASDATWSLFVLNSSGYKFRFDYSSTANRYVASALSANTQYTVTADGPTFTWSGGTGTTHTKVDAFTEAGGPLALFASYYDGINNHKDFYSNYKLYSFKIWQSGALIHDLVPAVRDSDFKIGLYDNVSGGTFYPGTGSFRLGDAIAGDTTPIDDLAGLRPDTGGVQTNAFWDTRLHGTYTVQNSFGASTSAFDTSVLTFAASNVGDVGGQNGFIMIVW